MKERLQKVLDRVRDPETNQTVSELGLVERIRYHPVQKKLSVFISPIRPAPACCTIIADLLLSSTLEELSSELQREFPDLRPDIIRTSFSV